MLFHYYRTNCLTFMKKERKKIILTITNNNNNNKLTTNNDDDNDIGDINHALLLMLISMRNLTMHQ